MIKKNKIANRPVETIGFDSIIKQQSQPQLVWLSGLSVGLRSKGSQVRFLVSAHAWVAGWVPR